jgi:hypothetical protein
MTLSFGAYSEFRLLFLNPFTRPEISSHNTIMTMPIAKKFMAPIFFRKSEKYSIVSILQLLNQRNDISR